MEQEFCVEEQGEAYLGLYESLDATCGARKPFREANLYLGLFTKH